MLEKRTLFMFLKKGILNQKLKDNPVLIHTVTGIVIGYFLLHPITMVIYWFEMSNTRITFNNLLESITDRLIHAFYMHMMPMSAVFIIIGGLAGMGSGMYFRKNRDHYRKIQSQRYQLLVSIESLILNGENEKVEFKSSFRYDFKKCQVNKALEDVVIKSIAGFMNANGGILIIGIDDQGCLLGLQNDYNSLVKQNRDGFEQKIIQAIADKLGTDLCPFVHIGFHLIIKSDICSVYVEKANRPVYVEVGGDTIFYLRTGNITKPLNTKETVMYLKGINNYY